MTALMVIQVVDIDTDYYWMSMNLYNVDVEANNTKQSLHPQGQMQPLGDIAFIWQSFNGTVLRVAFSRNDPDFFIEVKLGAANALQTHVVAPGKNTSVLTLDPVGAYMADVVAVGEKSALMITKNFTQSNVVRFTDPTVDPDNVVISAGTVTAIGLDGVIKTANVDQFVQLVNVNNNPAAAAAHSSGADTNTSSLDINLSSRGRLEIDLQSQNGPSPFNQSQLLTPQQVMRSPNFIVSSLFEAGVNAVKAKRAHASRIHDIDAAVDAWTAEPKNERSLSALARYFAARPAAALLPLETRLKSGNRPIVAAVLHLLARIDTEPAQALLVAYGLESAADSIRQQAILASYSFTRVSPALLKAMRELSVSSSPMSRMALFALGSMYGRSELASEAPAELLPRLKTAIQRNDVRAVSAALYAIANAGTDVIDVEDLGIILAADRNSVQKALIQPVEYVVNKYAAAQAAVTDNDLPYNHTWGGGIVVGGRKINAGFNATTFAGTNFNCNQTYFNYEVIGTSASNVTLFRWHTTTFWSQTVYGLINSQPAANRILVEIFGKVFYDEPLPSVDCFQETIPIFTQQTGLNKQYTLWISVIPVTFTATVSLSLNLDVQFEACLDKLSASLSLLPTATLTFGGGAEVNLLVVRAGIRLEGSFSSTLVPEGAFAMDLKVCKCATK
eukprot:TRINITY_DN7034_c0_g1_i1.p1 TRINITY_DN7034_c0_g1~~TRINITY_DN7034_c0_g1_i1.p1  ORF type:complete len:754 (+),score=326.84 TRINITY_DN7034_c0_g1_i1:241-2262(+)